MRLALILALAAPLAPAVAQETPPPTLDQLLTTAAAVHRSVMTLSNGCFSGPAYDRLIAEGRAAQFFLLGEEHGIAEGPKLAAALFRALQPAGYQHFVIEVSPQMATLLDARLHKGGLAGLSALYAEPGGEPAFFGMREEAHMLADVRGAVPGARPVLWGVDYEVLGDRQLIKALAAMPKPAAARAALAALAAASDAAWARHRRSGEISGIFSFGGDPQLVRAVREAWPGRDAQASAILKTLEETLEINALFLARQGWQSNARRAELIRGNFIQHWQAATGRGPAPKVMAKMGASHLLRGRSTTEVFDLGTLLPEVAALNGGHSFSLLVVPGEGALTAVSDPATLTYNSAPAKDGYARDLGPLMAAAASSGFTLIDLRPLRATRGLGRPTTNPGLLRTIMGYDMMLILTGSTPSAQFSANAQSPPAPACPR
ncbi:hypothetical protein [Sandarakinorhabdus rubra]|uniref:hypothetical protein n=1 Tax=Sandarakinorhabdus rubra TaxID=2672568 RepID=UPI0013DB36E3|nr:hypothetical protein [Sandarakinorhabdus rubra]